MLALVSVPLQLASGDAAGQMIASTQPEKLAAAEEHYDTEADALLVAFGVVKIPYGLSLLAHHNPHAVVTGLNDFPRSDWPPVMIVHIAFELMVACGSAMMAVTLWAAWALWRRRQPRLLLWAGVLAAPLVSSRSSRAGQSPRGRPPAVDHTRRLAYR